MKTLLDAARSALPAACALALAACGPDRHPFDDVPVAPDDVVRTDARDATPADAPVLDAPRDDAPADAPLGFDARDATLADAPDASDAPLAADADAADARDAALPGRCTPTIDGVIADPEWSGAVLELDTLATGWTGNTLSSIRVCYDATRVYFGIEGTVEDVNGMVVYLDRDFRGGAGGTATGISDFTVLADHTGALDSAISAALSLGAGAAGFGAEGAWGTRGMRDRTADGTDDFAGLRLFWPTGGTAPDGGTVPDRRANFAFIAGAASVCTASSPPRACEVSILWSSLFEGPRPASTTLALFVRINNATGDMSSNQSLPQDAPMTMARTVNRLLVLDVRP